MIVELNGFICQGNIGSKARSLVDLNRYGYKVPTSIALDTNEYLEATKNIKDKINLLLNKVTFNNIEMISKQIKILLERIKIKEITIIEIQKTMQDGESYLFRCSVDGVDEDYSYAGLFPTIMGIDKDNIELNIIECYKSLFSYNSLYYMLKNNIDYSNISMAIIIQKEIKVSKLGYVQTMNPVTLNSSELLIEIVENKKHEKCCYDYIKDEFIYEEPYKLLSKKQMLETIALVKSIQSNLGYPAIIELAYTKNDIYVIQTRELVSILYENQNTILKKQNISSKKFMWSLISSNYNEVIKSYYEDLKLDITPQINPLIFNHCYYNVLNISQILEQYINYDDNYFDSSLSIIGNIPRKNNLSFKLHRLHNSNKKEQKINEFLDQFDEFKNKYKLKYSDYCHNMSKVSAKEIESIWLNLVFFDYKELFTYFLNSQILTFIEKNSIYCLLKDYLSLSEFNELINLEEEMSNYKINYEFNEIVKKIKEDEKAYQYWFSSSTLKILKHYDEQVTNYYHKEFRHFIDNYGYLSYFDMDLSESFYVEDVEDVIRDIKKRLANFKEITNNKEKRTIIDAKLKNSLKAKKYEKYSALINRLQTSLVKLSEIQNYLYKFNFIVKRYTKMLAKTYLNKKVIECESDIWHLDINTIYDYTEGEIGSEEIKKIIEKNKLYYNSYRNFKDIDFMGEIQSTLDKYDYEGIGYSAQIIEGRVRIIKSLQELDTLSSNDILVTKTINNNLLFHLPRIKGIIISNSNLDWCVKDMIRELKIPCILLENCSKKLKDNTQIKADCFSGKIKVLK